MKNKIGMISLGCAKNRVNSEQMVFLLAKAGYQVSGDVNGVDAVIVNTCGFIESAKSEAIDTILEIADEKASRNVSKLIVAGCLPQRYMGTILQELPEIDAVVGVGSFDQIVSVVKEVFECAQSDGGAIKRFGEINSPVSEARRIISTSSSWAYLKISEGCDNCCAYCSIPSIRGRLRSRPYERIIAEATELADANYKELILIAQDVTAYGMDLYGKRSLLTLLRAISSIENLEWIRLLYMYPDGFDEELIDEIANNGKIVKYLDIPIQHINDRILRGMNRRGTGTDIRNLFEFLKNSVTGVVLRTSLITGLPGEGEQEFKELYAFLKAARIERAGVFVYSPEEGTAASKMKRPGTRTAESRAKKIEKLQSRIMSDFARSRIGTVERVLIEDTALDHDMIARSYAEAPEVDGYIRVKSDKHLKGFADVKITNFEDGELVGEMLNEHC